MDGWSWNTIVSFLGLGLFSWGGLDFLPYCMWEENFLGGPPAWRGVCFLAELTKYMEAIWCTGTSSKDCCWRVICGWEFMIFPGAVGFFLFLFLGFRLLEQTGDAKLFRKGWLFRWWAPDPDSTKGDYGPKKPIHFRPFVGAPRTPCLTIGSGPIAELLDPYEWSYKWATGVISPP